MKANLCFVPRLFGICAAFVVLLTSSVGAGTNILLIIADDLGVESLSKYNSDPAASLPPTPVIDGLADAGIRFNQAYAYSVCSPTRACIMTGRYGFRTGIGDVVEGPGDPVLVVAEWTLPEVFTGDANTNWALACFGKWHLGSGVQRPRTVGGWPHFSGFLSGGLSAYTNWSKTINGTTMVSTNYATTDVVDDAIDWIGNQGATSWFAWVAFAAPHTPFHKPPNDLHSYDGLPGTSAHIALQPRRYFEAMVESMDTEIGRLLAAANSNETTVIFIGDNGTTGQVLQPPYSNGHGKGSLYEGGVRVPMIVAGPTVVQGGRTSEALVHVVDLFATILDLAGMNPRASIPASTVLDSRSFLSVLENKAYAPRRMYNERFDLDAPTTGGQAIRDSRFKLIRLNDGRDELYDLRDDPYETNNLVLSVSPSAVATQHADRLQFWLQRDFVTTDAFQAVEGMRWDGNLELTFQNTGDGTQILWRCTDLLDAFWQPVSAVSNGAVLVNDDAPPISNAYYMISGATYTPIP